MLASSTGHSPPSGAADSTAPRRPRRSSLANHTAHQREKAKSSSSHPQDGRHKSVSSTAGAGYIGAAGDPSRTVRPTMKSRAYSAPLINHSHFRDSEDESEESDDAGEEALRAEMGDEITGDPFFQRYNFSTSNSQAVEGVGTIEEDDSSDTEGPKSPLKSNARPRPDSVAEPLASPISPMGSRSFAFETTQRLEPSPIQDINIIVVGEDEVGKSTFIQRAIDARTPPTTTISTRRMALEGEIYTVRLIELEFDDMEIDEDDKIAWPDTVDDIDMPAIHGALILYDVMDKESLVEVPNVLKAIHKASIPFLLVSCKCDGHPSLREIDPDVVEKRAREFIGADVGTVQTACSSPDSQKRCLSVIIRDILGERPDKLKQSAARRRANTGAPKNSAQTAAAITKHSRASSEYSATVFRARTGMMAAPASAPVPNDAPSLPTKSHPHLDHNLPGPPTQKSFLNLDESPGDGSGTTTRPPSQPKSGISAHTPSDEVGYTFDQLVDRFLEVPLSKTDEKFKDVFLALFRLFASPYMLLDAIITRFEATELSRDPVLVRTMSQQRYMGLFQIWISNYPGDFAHPVSRLRFSKFLARVATIPLHAAAAHILTSELELVVEDDDTNWAFCDRDIGPSSGSAAVAASQGATFDRSGRKASHTSLASTDTAASASTLANSVNQASSASGSPWPASTNPSSSASAVTLLSIVESAQKSAKSLTPHPRYTFGKVHWRLLKDIPDDVVAKELTRMDWTLLSSIRPRDLVRHVSMSKSAKDKTQLPGLENVDRMSTHFNRLAAVVSNFVLMRDKPTHRALMLEKWMRIAREVRKLNNYNSLGAILAGLHSSSVHRLAMTRELITAPAAKDFMKLEILMGTAKSHFAYRLAWENSNGERIPYLPLHRRDLVSASEGNKTFLEAGEDAATAEGATAAGAGAGEGAAKNAEPGSVDMAELKSRRINWRKFEIMGDVIVELQRAQAVPYQNLTRNEEVKMLVLETKISLDEDELYERSVAIEPSGPAGAVGPRKFNWFQR